MGWHSHIATMAYNVFPHSLSGEAPFYLMFEYNAFMLTLFKSLLPKLRYMGEEKYKILLDAMWEIYMSAELNILITLILCLMYTQLWQEAIIQIMFK